MAELYEEKVFSNVRNKKILVIGDAVVDKYISGATTRISPDSPVPVVDVQEKEFYLGGIGLVLKYILSFGADVQICTLVGDDFEGQFFLEEVQELNLGTKGVFQEECFTPQITRIKSRGQHMLRLEKKYEISKDRLGELTTKMVEFVREFIDKVDVLVILDYGMGLFVQNYVLINNILTLAKEKKIKVIVRPDKANYHLFSDVYISKINLNLASSIVGINPVNETSIRIIGNKMMNDIKCCALYLSYLDADSYFFQDEKMHLIKKVIPRHGISYVGVGSAIMAALAVVTAAGGSRDFAIKVANFAGALSAMKPPVDFFTLEELHEAYKLGAINDCES